MAFAVVPDKGELDILNMIAEASAGAGYALAIELYVNDVTPDQSSVEGDFTLASWTGYAPGSYMVNTAASVGGKAQFGDQTFTFIGPVDASGTDVYGWLMRRIAGGELVMAARFAGAPLPMTDDTDSVRVVLNWRLWDAHQP
jgi:hypothetical protein